MSDQDLSPQLFEQRIRRLRNTLYVSLGVNALLLIGGIVFWHAEARALLEVSSFAPVKEQPQVAQEAPTSLAAVFETVSQRQFSEIMPLFRDKTVVIDGIKMRDVALSVAISQYDFNINKALKRAPEVEKLQLSGKSVSFIPSLSDEDFAKIEQFSMSEKYPFTSRGIVALLAKNPGDSELKKASTVLPEYVVAETLLKRVYKVSTDEIALVLSQISFDDIDALYEEEKKGLQLNEEKARSLLVAQVKKKSKVASLFLLQHDTKYVVHQLEDSDLLVLLQLIEDKEIGAKIGQIVLKSSRREAVKQVAKTLVGKTVSERKKEIHPEAIVKPSLLKPAVKSVSKAKVYVASAPPLKEKTPKKGVRYVVQGGDTLWSISKKFHVDVKTLKASNHLASEALKPGSTLEIPG